MVVAERDLDALCGRLISTANKNGGLDTSRWSRFASRADALVYPPRCLRA